MLQRVASAPSIFNQPVGSFQFEAPSLFGAPAPAPSTGPRIPTLLQELDLSYNGISDKGAKDLADALTVNTKLRKLSLRGNVIGEVGAKALVEAFVGHSYGYNSRGIILPTLDLGENHDIGNDGALAIAGTLKTNIKLEDLGLSHCIIGDVGAKALGEALKVNTGLRNVNLSGNKITAVGAMAMAEALKDNTGLRNVNLAGNNITAVGAVALAVALKENAGLRSLQLDDNNIDGANGDTAWRASTLRCGCSVSIARCGRCNKNWSGTMKT